MNFCVKRQVKRLMLCLDLHYQWILNGRDIMNSFLNCLFSYCRAIRMFHSRKLNARINWLHERAVWVVLYKNFDSSFEGLPRRDNSITLHQRNLQKLMTKPQNSWKIFSNLSMYLIIWGISPNITVAYHVPYYVL